MVVSSEAIHPVLTGFSYRMTWGETLGGYMGDSLILDLRENQPAVVPAARARRIADDLPFGLIQALGAERIVLGEATKFTQEVIGVDVVGPGRGHGFGDVRSGVGAKEFLDAT